MLENSVATLLKLSIPLILLLLIETLYTIVDTYWIIQIDHTEVISIGIL